MLDRVKIGGIWRQIPEPRADCPDGASHARRFVAAEIVHHDDVALAQGRRELLLDIGAEAFAVDQPVEDAGRGQPVAAQCAEEGQRTPVAGGG